MLCSVNAEKAPRAEKLSKNVGPPLSLLDLEIKEPTVATVATNNTLNSAKQSRINADNSGNFSTTNEDKPPIHSK